MKKNEEQYDVIVIGAGHAGCEAALAAARLGAKTVLITMNLSNVAQMSCNPAIGGQAKGHLVKEIDALGGQMGIAADNAGIQFRMLNKSKGPAVWSPRAQEDRTLYTIEMKKALENQKNLRLLQASVRGILVNQGVLRGVKTETGRELYGRAVVLTPGTFLNGLIHVGLSSYSAGRAGDFAAKGITEQLKEIGFTVGRLKTGTPPRVDGATVDKQSMTLQPGDKHPEPFSYTHESINIEQIPCYLTWTSSETHDILRSGLDRSPLYTGKIIGVGPRYCPSIETKIVRFADKERHQIFLEPEGRDTNEYYVNGFATSLPEDTQINSIHSIAGMEKAAITRLGYAIEYDFFPPIQLHANLETKLVKNLFFAGQINGTSGYEEAAAQGLMAGINAVLSIRKEEPFILKRSDAYIGVLIDDLVTKGTSEPYRMFTSLAEHRLLLRQDNADLRLVDYAQKYDLVNKPYYDITYKKQKAIEDGIALLKREKPDTEVINSILLQQNSSEIKDRTSLYDLLRRPEITLEHLRPILKADLLSVQGDGFWDSVRNQVEIQIKYEGFINRQNEQVARFVKLENTQIPEHFDYSSISSLSSESREKLMAVHPRSLGQASRISGVRQGDIAVLMIHLSKLSRKRK